MKLGRIAFVALVAAVAGGCKSKVARCYNNCDAIWDRKSACTRGDADECDAVTSQHLACVRTCDGSPALTSASKTKDAGAPLPPTPATLTPAWDDNKLAIPELKLTGSVFAEGLALKVYVDARDGMKAQVDGVSVTPSGLVDVSSFVGAMPPKEALALSPQIDFKKTIHFSFHDGRTLDVAIPAVRFSAIRDALKKAATNASPLALGDDGAPAPKRHSAVFLESSEATVVGPARQMKDVDWLVTYEKVGGRATKRVCSGYKQTGSTEEHSYPLELEDWKTTIVDRKTGDTVDEKTFLAPEQCPMFAWNGSASSSPSSDAVLAWLRTRRGK